MRNIKNTRTCKGCMEKKIKGKDNLLQIGYGLDGLEISSKTSIQGKGKTIYLCRNEECIKKAMKKKVIERYFKNCNVDKNIVYEQLLKKCGKGK